MFSRTSSFNHKYYLTPSYPRKRKYRFPFLTKKSKFNPLVRHPIFNKREKRAYRYTHIQYNAYVRKHNDS